MESPAPVQREFASTGECDKRCKRFGKSQTNPFNTYLDVGLTSNRPKSQTRGSGFRPPLWRLPQFKFGLNRDVSGQSFSN